MRYSLGRAALPLYAVLAFVYLLIPIVYTFIFSFNNTFKSNITWRGFTFNNWLTVCEEQGVCEAFGNSILIGVVSTVVATALGTAIAIALVRYEFKFRSAVSLLLFLPMATPEIVLGAGLASQFFNFGAEKGIGTVIIAHVMFCLSFVVVTVKARVSSLDPRARRSRQRPLRLAVARVLEDNLPAAHAGHLVGGAPLVRTFL